MLLKDSHCIAFGFRSLACGLKFASVFRFTLLYLSFRLQRAACSLQLYFVFVFPLVARSLQREAVFSL
jgi:hypothetical protein